LKERADFVPRGAGLRRLKAIPPIFNIQLKGRSDSTNIQSSIFNIQLKGRSDIRK